MNPNFHTRLKWHRTKKGYSLQELGKLSGISKQDLDRMETDKKPTEKQLADLNRVLEIDLNSILVLKKL